jgi:excisionase family DNA binding protein
VNSAVQARYINARQAATYLGVSVFSIYRLVERRAIPFIALHPSGVKEAGRPSVRFDLHALDVWMQKQTVKPLANFIDELRPQK